MTDLDPADVDEVRRRIVDPVIAAMLRPGELTSLTVAIEMADVTWWEFEHFDEEPQVWLRLRVGDEEFEQQVCKPGFWLSNATWVAAGLEDRFNDWICETRFGWGELRSGPDPGELPGPPPLPPGTRAISIHLNEAGALPLWEGGRPVDPDGLAISPQLRRDLLAWQQRAVDIAEAANSDDSAPQPNPGTDPVGMWVQYVSERSAAHMRIAAAQRREQALREWHDWVDELQSGRDLLVSRLREEVGPDVLVLSPPRLPRLH